MNNEDLKCMSKEDVLGDPILREAEVPSSKDIIEYHVAHILKEVEPETYNREGLQETPHRVAKMYGEIFEGYKQDPAEILSKTFEEDGVIEDDDKYNNGMVIVKDISFYSHCEHHMVPFIGKVHIAYIPGKKVVGLSKLARLVNCFAHRLQVQERLTKQIADAIVQHLEPQGVAVVIEAQHMCMVMRGVKNPTAMTQTSCVRGVFTDNTVRNEFLNLIK